MTSTTTARRPLTDYGNAERFVARFRDQLRFNASSGRWLVWDGRRWALDESGIHVRRAKETARLILAEAAHCEDEVMRKRLTDWARASEKASAIKAMIELARTEPGIPVTAQDLDSDHWLLNVRNGALCLKGTPKLRPHDPTDNCTALAGVDYQPDADSPRWLAFLNRIMDGDQDRIDYLQRLTGYCLTGAVTTQVFPSLYGTGANGKSVFTDTITWLLGDYSGLAPDSLLTVAPHQEHPTEIAGLQGKRLIVATENEEGKKLRVGLVKKMTGDAQLTGRFMRRDYFTFNRTHKTWIVTNHKPSVSEAKDAIWRRMHLIPFNVTIPESERDEHLLDKLREEGPGILAWAVRGCVAWQRDGLQAPRAVLDATADYRAESDVLADFLSDTCVTCNADNTVSRKAIRTAYVNWCRAVGALSPISANGLYERLRDVEGVVEGYVTEAGKRTRGFKGIALHGAPESTYEGSEPW